MEISSANILQKLPDFDDLLDVTDKIYEAVVRKLKLERDLKAAEANIILTAMTDAVYQSGGKPPSMAFINSTYAYTGFSGELIPIREELAQALAEVERMKSRLDLYQDFFNIWRTLNASERAVGSV